jgi:hypothetical protein
MSTIYAIDEKKLADVVLQKGSHSSPDEGVCLMEALAYVRGIAHTDHPPCVSPILGNYGRSLNDVLPDARRQDLKSLIPLLPGTADDGLDETRSYIALDWLIRTYTPAWLDLAGLSDEARSLRELRRIVDLVAAQQAGPVVRAAQTKAAAAWAVARAASWAAARAAAAGDAARAAAVGDAARDAAGDAAWAVARAAAAGDAAGAAAVGDAVGAATRAAAWAVAAGDAVGDAARDVLKPAVDQLQVSAIALFGEMIAPTSEAGA